MTLPVLILIPRGGYQIPDELSSVVAIPENELSHLDEFHAAELFSIPGTEVLKPEISALFCDPDRDAEHEEILSPLAPNGRELLIKGCFPNDIAQQAIAERYWYHYHERVESILQRKTPRIIIECHSMTPTGRSNEFDSGRPRPLISVDNLFYSGGKELYTSPAGYPERLLGYLKKQFPKERYTITTPFVPNYFTFAGHCMRSYGNSRIPYLRLSLSTQLFMKDEDMDKNGTPAVRRIHEIQKGLMKSLEKFMEKELLLG